MPMLQQIPKVAIQILKNGDSSVGLLFGRAHKNDTFGFVTAVVAINVVRLEEQKHPATSLIADVRGLLFISGTGQQQTRLRRAGWGDHNPTLVLVCHRRILDQLKAKNSDKKGNRFVVVPYHQRGQGK